MPDFTKTDGTGYSKRSRGRGLHQTWIQIQTQLVGVFGFFLFCFFGFFCFFVLGGFKREF